MSALKIAQHLSLPAEAVTQTFAIIARRGRGKTYTGSVMAEEMVAAGLPFVVIDPLGAWWGLRSSKDGKRKGLPVVILGGEHGDVPLNESAGTTVANLVVDRPGWYILDLSGFESNAAQDRFVTAFAERLYRAKAANRSPLHLFVDEADSFAPQRPMGDYGAKMLGAFEALSRRGRIRGIGVTLITQRPASLNKSVLTQSEVLVVLQITGPQDRAAVDDWVKQNATAEQREQFLASLASLAIGEAWVWSPSWLDLFRRVKIRERRTFDSGRTPAPGESLEVAAMAAVDIDALTKLFAAEIQRAEADDPVKLRQRITALERDLAKRPTEVEVKTVERIVEVPVLAPEVEASITELLGAQSSVTEGIDALKKVIRTLQGAANRRKPLSRPILVEAEPARRADTADRKTAVSASRPSASSRSATSAPLARIGSIEESPSYGTGNGTAVPDEGAGLRLGARQMLDVLVRHHPVRLTEAQWATLRGMKRSGGTWRVYRQGLAKAGLVEKDDNNLWTATPAGMAFSGVTPDPMTTDEVLETWRRKLRAGERNILDVLVRAYPNEVQTDDVAEMVGMEPTGGTFRVYVGTLRRNGLAVARDGYLRVAEAVMGV